MSKKMLSQFSSFSFLSLQTISETLTNTNRHYYLLNDKCLYHFNTSFSHFEIPKSHVNTAPAISGICSNLERVNESYLLLSSLANNHLVEWFTLILLTLLVITSRSVNIGSITSYYTPGRQQNQSAITLLHIRPVIVTLLQIVFLLL